MKKISNDALGRLSISQFKDAKKNPAIVVLDDVRSLSNVGSVFRTCDAFLIEKIYLCGITGCPPDKEIRKTALGSEESVLWEYHQNCATLLTSLKEKGYTLVAVEQVEGSQMLHHVHFSTTASYAFVFGNEVHGVQDEVLAHCDIAVEIPQMGYKHSLNVSVSTGIVLWHYAQIHMK